MKIIKNRRNIIQIRKNLIIILLIKISNAMSVNDKTKTIYILLKYDLFKRFIRFSTQC